MVVVLVALSAFLAGSGVTAMAARYFFLLGWEKGRDDRALDPGQSVGLLPSPASVEMTTPLAAVGESSGRHAKPEWPTAAERRAIDEDSRFERTQDANDYQRYERLMDGVEQ